MRPEGRPRFPEGALFGPRLPGFPKVICHGGSGEREDDMQGRGSSSRCWGRSDRGTWSGRRSTPGSDRWTST